MGWGRGSAQDRAAAGKWGHIKHQERPCFGGRRVCQPHLFDMAQNDRICKTLATQIGQSMPQM